MLKTKPDDQPVHLEIMARYAGMRGAVINDKMRTAMVLTMEKYGYFDMVPIDASPGKARLRTGGSFSAADREYFKKALAGERTIAYVERGRYSGIPVFSLLIPVYESNRVTAILVACLAPAGFIRLLEARAYGGQSYSYVTNGSGDIIISPKNPYALITEGNALAFFDGAELPGGFTAEDIAADMRSLDTLTFSFTAKGETRYAFCVLMGIKQLLIGVPGFFRHRLDCQYFTSSLCIYAANSPDSHAEHRIGLSHTPQ